MKRILAWREDFSSTMGTTCSGMPYCQHSLSSLPTMCTDTSPLKRKFLCSDDSDAVSPLLLFMPWLHVLFVPLV
jgi:hypothetical protein